MPFLCTVLLEVPCHVLPALVTVLPKVFITVAIHLAMLRPCQPLPPGGSPPGSWLVSLLPSCFPVFPWSSCFMIKQSVVLEQAIARTQSFNPFCFILYELQIASFVCYKKMSLLLQKEEFVCICHNLPTPHPAQPPCPVLFLNSVQAIIFYKF